MRLSLTIFLAFGLCFQSISQSDKKVLIIGIDGCRSDALEVAATPNIDALIANGLYSPDALNDDITISGPGWSAILCGVWSDKHLVTGNNFSGNDYATYPSIMSRVEAFDPSLNTASICHWSPINTNIIDGGADYILNVGTDVDASTQAVNHITNADPDCMFVHFDEVDGAGHGNGFSSTVPPYIAKIEEVDNLIGPIVTAVQNRPNYANEDWLYILTTDHGGFGTSHGGTTIDEEKVFFIVSGDSVAQEVILADEEEVEDAVNCLGSDISQLDFDGDNDNVQLPSLPIFDFGASQDFTLECRVHTSVAADVSILGNKDWDTGFNPGIVLSFVYPNGPGWKVNIGDGGNRVDINTGGSIANSEWHTLTVTCDRDGMMSMYEDGVFVDAASIAGIGNINTGQGFFAGTDINSAYDYSGAISEVRIWNSVLGSQDIQAWHCQTVTAAHPSFSDLLGYWKLDEGTGTSVADASVNSNDGTVSGAQWDAVGPITVYDYSNTPRLVDAPVTAMTHLCVPIDPAWNLDGISWVPDCAIADCEGDFDGDGIVNVSDLLYILAGFGCVADCGPADLDNNGIINAADLLQFLALFGNTCESFQLQLPNRSLRPAPLPTKTKVNFFCPALSSPNGHVCKHGGQHSILKVEGK
jgi:hypothetical protein